MPYYILLVSLKMLLNTLDCRDMALRSTGHNNVCELTAQQSITLKGVGWWWRGDPVELMASIKLPWPH